MIERNRRLSMKISDEEWTMLQALAERDGVSASDFVRTFIRRAYAEAFENKPKRGKK